MLSDITIFDFETTGLDAKEERVIEMAAMRVINGEIVTEFDTLIQLDGRELPPKITELTGIRPEMLVSGMRELRAFKILRAIMEDSLLVAHNAAFDLQFLHHSLERLGGRTFGNPFIDTVTICRERYTFPHKLEDMCNRLGIELVGAHRALNDVRATYQLLLSLNEKEDVSPFINRLGYLNKYGPPPWAPEHADLFGTDNRYDPRNRGAAV